MEIASESKNKTYRTQRRPPPKFHNKPNDIYIAENSNFKYQLEKCKDLLDTKFKELHLHGLGTAIPRAMNIALELKKSYNGSVDFTSSTSTVKLIDDLIPLTEETLPSHTSRNVSAIDIHIFRTLEIPDPEIK